MKYIKVSNLLKLEIINSFRDKNFKYLFLLPIIGVIFILSPYLGEGFNFFRVFIQVTGPLLGVTISPVIIASIMMGRRDIEILEIININTFKRVLCKILIILSVALYCIVITVIGFYVVGIALSVDISIINNYIGMIIFYACMYSVIYMCIGLLLGILLGHALKGAFAYMISVIFIYMYSGFGQTPMQNILLNNINGYSSYNIMKFDLYTLSLIQFWGVISVMLFTVFITVILFRKRSGKWKLSFCTILIMIALVYPSSIRLQQCRATEVKEYKVCREYFIEESDRNYENVSRVSKDIPIVLEATGDEKFEINKYNMDISLGNEFTNKCTIDMKILEDDLGSIDLLFYEKSKVKTLEINGQEVDYTQDSSRIYIDTSNLGFKKLEEVNLEIEYSSYIYTFMDVFEYHYVNNSGAYLDYIVAWYPMIHNDSNKQYEISVKTKNTVMFSNLDVENTTNGYNLSGTSTNIIILSGDDKIVSKEKDGTIYYSSDIRLNIDENFENMVSSWEGFKAENKENMMLELENINDIKKVFYEKRPYVIRQIGDSIVF